MALKLRRSVPSPRLATAVRSSCSEVAPVHRQWFYAAQFAQWIMGYQMLVLVAGLNKTTVLKT
jgi:hypothetical protein